ncbi:hypothetical protein [Aestuariivirga sp.]|uniref:hypothetical protein n=1 Tax=Aestuariivirga sp. TaxID=2650926 RepID=UPI00391DF9C4
MGLKMKDGRIVAAMALVGLLAAGCSTTGDSGGADSSSTVGSQQLSAAEIQTILAGKSWRFQGPNNTGTTLYAEDGSSLVEVDGKGTTKGKWMTKDGQLCESFDPAPPWLPGGVPMSCYPFSRGAAPGSYQAGKAVFTVAS